MCVVVSVNAEIVHEDVKMGSDGESDQASATSSDEVHSPVRVRLRNNPGRKISTEVCSCFLLSLFEWDKLCWVTKTCSFPRLTFVFVLFASIKARTM